MLIFFDFDGTLSDMSERWWRLHVDCMRACGGTPVSKKKYLIQKRNAISERIIVQEYLPQEKQVEKYIVKRKQNIEKNKYLAFDHLIPGAHVILKLWQTKGDLILLTRRGSKQNFFRQIKKYNIKKYFSRLVPTGGQEKETILKKEYTKSQLKGAYLITDSLEEVQMGEKLGMKVLAIGYGTRSPEYFQKNGISDTILTPAHLKTAVSYVPES